MAESALVYDIQGYSVHDGPGIRTTVFLKGCPLHCPWCHSPESQSFNAQVCLKASDCRGETECGNCIEACDFDAITFVESVRPLSTEDLEEAAGGSHAGSGADADGADSLNSSKADDPWMIPWIDKGKCTDCGACASACPPKALYVCGEEWDVESLVERVSRDRAFYDASGEGVTLSGGEPLSQLEFSAAFLRACKKVGLSTALDTTGFAPESSVREILPYVDLFLLDVKNMDGDAHKLVTGVPNEPVLRNARLIASLGGKMQIRVPIIPGFNDGEQNLRATAAFCRSLGDAVVCVQLLPYHTLGIAKYERLQEHKAVFETVPPSEEKMQVVKAWFEEEALNVKIH